MIILSRVRQPRPIVGESEELAGLQAVGQYFGLGVSAEKWTPLKAFLCFLFRVGNRLSRQPETTAPSRCDRFLPPACVLRSHPA